MKTLCITGFDHPALNAVAATLFSAGLAEAKPVARDPSLDMHTWHARVVAKLQGNGAPTHIGRLWEQLAGDIFMANLDAPVWGWSTPHSAALLDFWLQFDPHLYFVLTCVTPLDALAHAIASPSDTRSPEVVLQQWLTAHQAMLRFHLRHPERSVLIGAEHAAQHPEALIAHVDAQWALGLDATRSNALDHAPRALETDAVARHLARERLHSATEAGALQHEIEASITALVAEAASQAPAASVDAAADVIASYRQLRDRSHELQQMQSIRDELAATRITLTHQLSQVQADLAATTQARDEQTRLAAERKTQLDQLAKEKTELTQQRDTHKAELAAAIAARDALKADLQKQHDAAKASATELADAREEAELLLQQLHQVQEELETIFLKEQETAKQRDTHKVELAAATKARDEQTKLAAERKTQLDQLAKEKTELTKQRDTHKAELAAATKARDEQTKLAAERKTQLDQLAKEKTELTKQRDTHKTELAAAIAARDALKADLQKQHDAAKASAAELTDTREEAELLLQQLHQVQEELEHYFLEHRAAQQLAETREARWQRMLQRNPGYCDFESLRSTPSATGDALQWQINGLETAGRSIPALHCETLLDNASAAFRFTRQPGESGALLRWPEPDAANITLHPVAASDTLARLATSDLTLLQNLALSLGQALDTPAALALPADFAVAPLQRALQQLPQQLAALPPVLRFDHVRLKNNQINPDYEHLWLALDNLSLGTQRWPQFEFRLSCANVRPRRFGTHPKLEFPQHLGQAPLPGWFEESDDDHGAKLELRFALPEAMDLQIWNQLGDADRHFLRALIDALPTLLATLQASGAQISRAWQDWCKLADDSRRILALRAPVENAADARLQ